MCTVVISHSCFRHFTVVQQSAPFRCFPIRHEVLSVIDLYCGALALIWVYASSLAAASISFHRRVMSLVVCRR